MSYSRIEVNEMLLDYDRGKRCIVPVIMLLCNLQFIQYVSALSRGKIFIPICKRKHKERREIFHMYQKGIKNGSVPGDMLVLSVMTLSADLLRQIATDPHGFSRAHSIGNGLFNFPQGALPFPRYASLKRHPLFGLVCQIKIFTECCIKSARTLTS